VGSQRIGELFPIDEVFRVQVKAPNRDNYKDVSGGVLLYGKGRPNFPSSKGGLNSRLALFLDRDERTSVSFAFAALWRDDQGQRLPWDRGVPIFDQPGTYLVKCKYLVSVKRLKGPEPAGVEEKYIEQVLEVKVAAPEGPDKAVYDLLKKDQQLASALMRPVDAPAKEAVPKLKEIIEKFPKSSYAPYARFALARAYLNGLGLDTPSSRVRRALTGDELEAVTKHHYDAEAKRIIPNTFPYRPNALVLLSQLDATEAWFARSYLHKEHPDSLEWIEEFASLLSSSGTHRGRYEAEQLVGRFPPEDPILSPDDAKTRAFIDDKWRSFRKR
jgi:hypothetical protein